MTVSCNRDDGFIKAISQCRVAASLKLCKLSKAPASKSMSVARSAIITTLNFLIWR